MILKITGKPQKESCNLDPRILVENNALAAQNYLSLEKLLLVCY